MRTLAQAIRGASRTPKAPEVYSCWKSTVHHKGKKKSSPWRHNLLTTTAVGYTNAYDWLSKAMGMGPSAAFATAQGTATATSGTSLTNAGASFPTAGQGLAGQIVVVGANAAGAGSVVYGVIVANSSTVLTVDQWYSGTSTTGAAGTTPNATGQYMILPGQNPASWMAVTANVFVPATSDTVLAGELTSSVGLARAVGTYAHTAAASTYTLIHLWTASGAGATVNNEAQFGAATTTAGGVMPFESAEPSPPTLVSGDTLQNTVTITL